MLVAGEPGWGPYVVVDRQTGRALFQQEGRMWMAMPGRQMTLFEPKTPAPFTAAKLEGGFVFGFVGGRECEDCSGTPVVLDLNGGVVWSPSPRDPGFFYWYFGELSADGSFLYATVDETRGITSMKSFRLPSRVPVEDRIREPLIQGLPLGFRDVVGFSSSDNRFIRVKDGRVVWRSKASYLPSKAVYVPLDVTIAEKRGEEILIVRKNLGAIHVLSLKDGRELLAWHAPLDLEGFCKAAGVRDVEEALSRCHETVKGIGRTEEPTVPVAGYPKYWRVLVEQLGIASAKFLDSGDVVIVTDPHVTGTIKCSAPPRAFAIGRHSRTVTFAGDAATVLGVQDAAGYLVPNDRGPWFFCQGYERCVAIAMDRFSPGR